MPTRLVALIACVLFAHPTFAQSTTHARKWEIEVHASGFLKDDANSGVKRLPGPGTAFATTTPNVNSRFVPSFLFGDGNALINQVLVGRGLNPIPSLDGAILNNRYALERQSNIGTGFRLSRYISRRFWLDWTNEYDLDYDHGTFEINEKEVADSYVSLRAWVTSLETLFASCGQPCPSAVAAGLASTHERGHQISSAFTTNYDLHPFGRFVPYIGAGAGLVLSFGGTPRQEYRAHYSLLNNTIQGLDHVSIHFQVPAAAPALVVVSGAKYQLNERWGLRMEMRNCFESHSFKTIVSAAPEFTEGGVGNAITLSGGGVGVQFSDNQSLAATSLSAPLSPFRTFKSTGLRYEGRISGGVYYRF